MGFSQIFHNSLSHVYRYLLNANSPLTTISKIAATLTTHLCRSLPSILLSCSYFSLAWLPKVLFLKMCLFVYLPPSLCCKCLEGSTSPVLFAIVFPAPTMVPGTQEVTYKYWMSKWKPLLLELEIGHSKMSLFITASDPQAQGSKVPFPGRSRNLPGPMKNSVSHGSPVIYLAIEWESVHF